MKIRFFFNGDLENLKSSPESVRLLVICLKVIKVSNHSRIATEVGTGSDLFSWKTNHDISNG